MAGAWWRPQSARPARNPTTDIKDIFTKYRKTHNEAVFDIYTPRIRAARSAHVITGLPDAYGRGRIIGDYRRVALYGVDRLIEFKQADKAAVDDAPFSEHWARFREEHAEQIKALKKLKAIGRQLRLRHLRSRAQRQGSRAVDLLRLPGLREVAGRRRHEHRAAVGVLRLLLPTRPRRGPDHRGRCPGDHRRPW